jgi:hypothetical protein
MKKRIVVLSLALALAPMNVHSAKNAREIPTKKEKVAKKETRDTKNRYQVDTIIAVIPNPEGNKVITQSELDRPAIDGTIRSKKDLIRNARLYNKAKEYGMLPSESDIDDHLNMIKRENKMSHDDIVKLFDSAGYTFAEGREQLGEMFATSTLVNVKIQSRLLIPERDVRAYYDANPIYLEPEYQIQRGLVPFDANISRDEQREQIEAMLRAGKKLPNVEWIDPFWIDIADIAQDKMFITQMQPGEVRLSQEMFEGFELFKLVNAHERRLKSFEDRYGEIADILRRPRYERLFAEFEQQLEAQMPVVDLEVSDAVAAGA